MPHPARAASRMRKNCLLLDHRDGYGNEEDKRLEPIKIESLCDFQFVSQPGFSPDGTKIAFVVSRVDEEKNAYQGDLYVYDRAEKKTLRLTTAGDVKSYAWAGDQSLIFPAGREKKEAGTCFYEISLNGGEAGKSFELPVRTDSVYYVGEDRYLVTAMEQMEGSEETDPAWEIVDEIPFWFNGKGFTNGKRRGLYLWDKRSGKLTKISGDTEEVSAFSVRGSRVLYQAYPWRDVRGAWPGVYLYDSETGEKRCLLEKDVRRTGLLSFWADDEALITSAEDNPHGNSKYMDFYRMDLKTGEMRFLTGYDFGSGSSSVGSDARLGGGRTVKTGDGVCWFVTTRGHSAYLYSINRSGNLEGVVTKEGSCDSFDVAPDGSVVCCGFYDNRLAELYLDGERITDRNDMGRWQISVPEELSFTAKNGSEITGWIMKPAGYEQGKKYPAILNIHGGPRTVFGTVFHHEMQIWASEGYFVFYTNPHGSDGFGTEFGDINGRYGTVDYEDLMEFTDHVLEKEPDIDPSRVGVTGGSYGGFMTNWIIGHTDRFAAAASQRSIANWISFEHMSDIGHTFTKDNQAVFTKEDAAKLWFHSPIRYIGNCHTPTLFVHSDEDYRCNMAEGMQMFAALKILGVETRLCLLHGENHELSRSGKPGNRIVRMREILNWMDAHLKGDRESGVE